MVPVATGADKFMHLLTAWNKYLSSIVADIVPLSLDAFMGIVGVIEITASVIVFIRPRLGSLIVGLRL